MTKDEQKAELRRCAMYEAEPFLAVGAHAIFPAYNKFMNGGELIALLSPDDQRTLFLLFAEAL